MIKFAFARAAVAGVALMSLHAAPAAARSSNDGFDRRIVVINESSQTIREVRGSPVSWDVYGNDLIPGFVIHSGEQARVNPDKGTGECMYDLQVTMADGNTVNHRANVCRITQWTIED